MLCHWKINLQISKLAATHTHMWNVLDSSSSATCNSPTQLMQKFENRIMLITGKQDIIASLHARCSMLVKRLKPYMSEHNCVQAACQTCCAHQALHGLLDKTRLYSHASLPGLLSLATMAKPLSNKQGLNSSQSRGSTCAAPAKPPPIPRPLLSAASP